MRLEGIDILRGLAVSVVILYHFFELLELHTHSLYPYIYSLGLLGVPLFFIISGYLIYRSVDYSISMKGIKFGLRQYFSHRLFRILPAFYVNFLVVFILAFYFTDSMNTWPSDFILRQIWSHLTFTSFFIYKTSGLGINGAYWTLSIEMLWYIVAPLFFIYIKKDRYLIILFILSILYLIGLDLSLYNTILGLDKNSPNYFHLLFYLSSQFPGQLIYFIAGIFIYKYTQVEIFIHRFIKYFLFTLLLFLFIYLSDQKYFLESFTIKSSITLLTVIFIFMLFYRDDLKKLYLISWLGKISYSLYLWHMPILFILKKYIMPYDTSWWFISILFIILLLSISSLSYYLIEETGFTLRKKLENRIN